MPLTRYMHHGDSKGADLDSLNGQHAAQGGRPVPRIREV